MAKSAKKPAKKRASKYEPKVTFSGTFQDLVKVSVKDAEKRLKNKGK